jgi:flagellar biosynthesis protein FlhF
MRLKLYRAASMVGAMARVRAELGADALILGTRRVSDGIEVTAALEDDDPAPAALAPPSAPFSSAPSPFAPAHAAPFPLVPPPSTLSPLAPPRSTPSPFAPAPSTPVAPSRPAPAAFAPPPSGAVASAPPAAIVPVLPAWVRPATGRKDRVHAIHADSPSSTRPPDDAGTVAAATDPEREAALAFHAIPIELAALLRRGLLDTALERALPFGSLPLDRGGPPILLTGPPGAGKTLTIARLATRLVMGRIMPLVVTADGKRAGAAEQLAAFTKLLGIGLVVASHPVTLGRALTRRQDGAPVLIDAPGADPFDPVQADDLRGIISAAGAVAALVLPAGLDAAEAAETAVAFAEAGATLLIVTRLDLARRLGSVLAAAAAARLPLTEAGIGPGAADGLVTLSPAMLATRLMQTGTPRHASHAA